LNSTLEDLNRTRVEKAEVGKELSDARAKMVSLMMQVFDLKKAMESQNQDLKKLHTEVINERAGTQELNRTRNILAAKDRVLALAINEDDMELKQARKDIRTKDLEMNVVQMKMATETKELQAARTQAVSESKEVNSLRIELAIAKAGAKAAHAEENILGILTKELNQSRVAFAAKIRELDNTRKELASAKETCAEHGSKGRNATHAELSVEAKAQDKAAHAEQNILEILTKELNESRIAFAAKIKELDYTRRKLTLARETCRGLTPKDGNATHSDVSVKKAKAQAQAKQLNQTHAKLLVRDKELDAARLLIKTLEDNSRDVQGRL
jgi:hypothetical protein